MTYFFRHISNLPQTRGWEKKISEGPPCVVLATPGMLQSGSSRELLELWAPDPRNGLIVTGYSVEGTLARVSLGFILGTVRIDLHVFSFCTPIYYLFVQSFCVRMGLQSGYLAHIPLRTSLQNLKKSRR